MSKSKLKPCPFCGSTEVAQLLTIGVCNACGAFGPADDLDGRKWNKRASDKPAKKARKR